MIIDDENVCSCRPKILIVDDNMYNLIPLELLLKQKLGIDVDKAFNGEEAVKLYRKDLEKKCRCDCRYKLIFMDLNMPVMDGY